MQTYIVYLHPKGFRYVEAYAYELVDGKYIFDKGRSHPNIVIMKAKVKRIELVI